MSATLKNRIAIVTGAASGIGRASALAFSREGAKVAVVDIQTDAGNDTVERIRQAGGDASFVPCDVTEAREVSNMVEQCVKVFGESIAP